ncbi:bifunctional DNA primase/polymerase [Ponticoccus sp. SC2-23]|uniref:bifunctional DNA primase/polymerase n=1 Tax=Alexandriicola marinus TaxID=2081710 RepID=UPI000FD85480|nr:bifunctional DNA primase/polymerase [Alexandriicola marinus]MBM1220985.1 bifunctional DNA primase/polymerase [Ponticoccus sp. SC6-9]MBM1225555.1 bifunctional DNA primase/polymerase [Ponticoccus sp. SC6-15]MBM1231882.1 bifunctional DNA primase/polymerase [Ponticoccus sp. SC6-38]MBM1236397.1 bifunctional DNA primase/polymerase [Ponticoccus sp. SC6-45]MBM1240904.1 bifunctional DNA primase/polymerase [Ponticoccus sp. SC6-49]MBM1243478.1 bifunctional DNA primase/polymerase [Ponticoccus sp. SC2-
MSTPSSQMIAALAYAHRGWMVFPLGADTKGRSADGRSTHLLPAGHKDASCDLNLIRNWWTRWPDANIGLSLSASGLVAIDADLYKPGCDWYDVSIGKTLPPTFTQASPRGGRHYVFSADKSTKFPGKLCQGVDVKHHGYILLAPSTFEGKPYEVVDDSSPVRCPDWIATFCEPRERRAAVLQFEQNPANRSEVAELLSWIDPDGRAQDHADAGAEGAVARPI